MQAHWQSEDGMTEIWLNEWSNGKCKLTVKVPDEPYPIVFGSRWDGNDRWRYTVETAHKLEALTHQIFGGTDKMVAVEWYDDMMDKKWPPDTIFITKQWRMTDRQLEFIFIGKLADNFDAAKTNWQMDAKMLEAPNA